MQEDRMQDNKMQDNRMQDEFYRLSTINSQLLTPVPALKKYESGIT